MADSTFAVPAFILARFSPAGQARLRAALAHPGRRGALTFTAAGAVVRIDGALFTVLHDGTAVRGKLEVAPAAPPARPLGGSLVGAMGALDQDPGLRLRDLVGVDAPKPRARNRSKRAQGAQV